MPSMLGELFAEDQVAVVTGAAELPSTDPA
jgi:hypothetical protein